MSNLTRTWSQAVVEVGVDYATDLDRALTVLRDELTRFQADSAWTARFEGKSRVLGAEQIEIPYPQRTVHLRHSGAGRLSAEGL